MKRREEKRRYDQRRQEKTRTRAKTGRREGRKRAKRKRRKKRYQRDRKERGDKGDITKGRGGHDGDKARDGRRRRWETKAHTVSETEPHVSRRTDTTESRC